MVNVGINLAQVKAKGKRKLKGRLDQGQDQRFRTEQQSKMLKFPIPAEISRRRGSGKQALRLGPALKRIFPLLP